MSNVKLEISQSMLAVSIYDSGATLSLDDLPPSIGSSIRFEVRSLEGLLPHVKIYSKAETGLHRPGFSGLHNRVYTGLHNL